MVEHNSQHEEQEMAELLKRALKPASPSPEFKERLRQRLIKEAQEQATRKSKPVWQSPWIWAPAAAAALGLILAFLLVPLFSAATGTVVVRITDASPKQRTITELNVAVTRVEIHRAGDTESDEGTWETVFEGFYETNLLDLADVVDTIGSTEVPAGKYTQIRIGVEGSTAFVEEGELLLPLKVPSEELKIVNPPDFEVTEDGTTILTLDFDIHEEGSIVDKGDSITLRPTIKLEVTQED